nr:uncharacterized protein LOC111515969 [Leptinotarsa decemlineata]
MNVLKDICFNLNEKHMVVDLSREEMSFQALVNLSQEKQTSCERNRILNEIVLDIPNIDYINTPNEQNKGTISTLECQNTADINNYIGIIDESKEKQTLFQIDITSNNMLSDIPSIECTSSEKNMVKQKSSRISVESHSAADDISFDFTMEEPAQKVENVIFEFYDIDTYADTSINRNCSQKDKDNISLCMYCGIILPDLDEHIQKHHGLHLTSSSNNVDTGCSQRKNQRELYPNKKHNCVYCNKLHFKLARHLQRKHFDEEDVKKACSLKKGTHERRILFTEIQKKGDFLFNSKAASDGEIIRMRRKFKNITTTKNMPCPYCKGFYSKKNLKSHSEKYCIARNGQNEKYFQRKGLKNTITCSRSVLQNIHEIASEPLRTRIFPVLTDDVVTRAIAHDHLAIQFGNFLAIKYSSSYHHDKMIRSKLRQLSRILLEMKKIDPSIEDVKSIYDCNKFDTFINAIYSLGGWSDGRFAVTSIGPSSVTLILHVGDILETEAVKNKDYELEKETQRFCKLVSTRSNYLINKMAHENRSQIKRTKEVLLPELEDIKQLQKFLDKRILHSMDILRKDFELKTWKTLCKTVLVKLMTFNRKRPGDVERTQIFEYKNLQLLSEDQLNNFKDNMMEYESKYGRYITRGKLNRDAAILVGQNEIEAIEIILKYREKANILNDNPYLFACPLGSAEPFFKAGKALKDFCLSEGLNSNHLNATSLRKHLATITSDFEKEKRLRVSDFMGHNFSIHENIYKQRPASQDILEVVPVLNFASGSNTTSNIQYSARTTYTPHGNYIKTNSISDPESYTTPVPSSDDNDDDIQDMIDPTYQPDLSKISEENSYVDSEQPEELKRSTNRLNRKHTFRVNNKKTWSTPEKSTVKDIFKNYLLEDNENVPSLETCQEFIYKNQILKDRTAIQVRSWIVNQKKRMKSGRSGWSTPMKQRCRMAFQSFYETGQYPTSDEIIKFLNSDRKLFEGLTVPNLRSHLQHDRKYLKSQQTIGRQLFL